MAKKRGVFGNSKKKSKGKTKTYIESDFEVTTLREGNVSLILDDYQDLFSDFDPRNYSDKALSDDFLSECRRASRDKSDGSSFELRLLIPKNKRNLPDEDIIKKRLTSHFEKHYQIKLDEQKKIKKHGIIWTLVGWILLFISGMIYLYDGPYYSFFQLLFVVFNPAGWFTMWTGFDKFFSDVKEKEPELEFYKKMASIKIYFFGY